MFSTPTSLQCGLSRQHGPGENLTIHSNRGTNLNSPSRLFHLRHGREDAPPYRGPFSKEYDAAAVRVTVRSELEPTDLVSCLAAELVDDVHDFKQNVTILEASDVLAFYLAREFKPLGERQKFSYPSTVYLDQFMKENAVISAERR